MFTPPRRLPVTLTVFDGVAWASQTQHVTVDAGGAPIDRPALVLAAPDSLAFRPRPVPAMDVYGHAPRFEPHTLRFLARPETSPRPAPRSIEVRNAGVGALASPVIHVNYREGMDWLSVQPHAEGLEIKVSAEGFPDRLGIYHAASVDCPGALSSPQVFSVRLETPSQRDLPKEKVIVDNRDPGCEATPWFWVAPQFHRHYTEHWPPGHRGDYLVARANAPGEFVRFTPDLVAGRYAVSLASETPFPPTSATPAGSRFAVRVRHTHGEETVWIGAGDEPRYRRIRVLRRNGRLRRDSRGRGDGRGDRRCGSLRAHGGVNSPGNNARCGRLHGPAAASASGIRLW